MKLRLRLLRVIQNFNVISDNPNVSFGIVDCSPYTCPIALKDEHHRTRMTMLAYTPVGNNYLETRAKTSITPATQNQFMQENLLNIVVARLIAISMNTNSAFNRQETENPFCYQKIDLRQIRILREKSEKVSQS